MYKKYTKNENNLTLIVISYLYIIIYVLKNLYDFFFF